jgi:DNA-directed RNA polymerase subunit L/DNA-directed RNA polymerase alpha subunit
MSVFQDFDIVDSKTLKFRLSPASVTYANSIRRAVQTEVSILGFRADMTEGGSTSDVKVYKNSTPMSNEMLADRVGLLPIAMPTGSGWEKESVLFKLHVKNETDEVRLVTASDFECLEQQATSEERVRVPNTRFFHPDPVTGETCLLAVLKPMVEGQQPEEIHLEAFATLGKGREHTRFNPVAQCAYAYTRDDSKDRILELWQKWLKEMKKLDPTEVEKDSEKKAMLEREFRSLEIYRCFKIDGDGEPYSYDFTVETVGTMDVSTIISESLKGLVTMCRKYESIDHELPPNVDIRPADAAMKGFDFWFTGEDHTMGNLLQTWLSDNKMDGVLTFAGYKVPHPLRDEMLLRIAVEDASEMTARLAIAEAAKALSEMFTEWTMDWQRSLQASGIKAPESAEPAKKVWNAYAEGKGKRGSVNR